MPGELCLDGAWRTAHPAARHQAGPAHGTTGGAATEGRAAVGAGYARCRAFIGSSLHPLGDSRNREDIA